MKQDDEFDPRRLRAVRELLVAEVEKAGSAPDRRPRRLAVIGLAVAGSLALGVGLGASAGLLDPPTIPCLAECNPDPVAVPASPNPTAPSNDAYARIPADEIQFSESEADFDGNAHDDFLWDAHDPYYGFNRVPVVARVYIDTIDGGRIFSPIFDQYVYPQTVGKMTVLEVYKGDLKAGSQVNYARPGGIVTFDEYWDSLSQQQREKHLHFNNGQKPTGPKYMQKKLMDDIDIEAGNDYVVLLWRQSSKDGTFHEYFIDGFKFGLREAKGLGPETIALNNETGEWEPLGSLLKLP